MQSRLELPEGPGSQVEARGESAAGVEAGVEGEAVTELTALRFAAVPWINPAQG